jgi:hypothetical protein
MAKAVTERTTPQRRADGVKAAKTMRAKYGKNYFERIGKKGGSRTNTKPKGFEANRSLARIAGARGGRN